MLIRNILSSTIALALLALLMNAATPVTASAAPGEVPAAGARMKRPERAVALLRTGEHERSSQRCLDQQPERRDRSALLVLFFAGLAGLGAVCGAQRGFGARA